MGRKLLGSNTERTEDQEESAVEETSPAAPQPPRPSRIMRPPNMLKGGAAAPRYIEGSTKSLVDRTHEDINVNHIQDSAIQDRIDLSYGIEELMESIEKDGQKVPIIVRIVNQDKTYEIVAGRRRLEAVRRLGHKTIRGFIHKMSDVDAFRLQGIENNQRAQTSFIERARTAYQAEQAGIEQKEVAEFLNITQPLVSYMRKAFAGVGEELATLIGPAPGIGRRKWDTLIESAEDKNLTSKDLINLVDSTISDSSDRFDDLFKKVTTQNQKSAPLPVKERPPKPERKKYDLPTGKYVTEISKRQFVVKSIRGASEEFLEYLDAKLPDLIEEFSQDREDSS